jgi:malonyl-CoA/methylmalonyl-CoA synthetase
MADNTSMYLEIARTVRSDPLRVAIETQDGTTFTYGDVDGQAARYANCLLDRGLKRGDRVAVQVEKSVQSLFLYLACLRAGLVYLPLNTAYRSSELDYFLRDAEPGLIVVRPENESVMNEVSQASIRAPVITLGLHGDGQLEEQVATADTQFDTVEANSDDLAVIIYTSGTTGRAKGAMVTHGNLVSNVRALVDSWQFSATDVLLHALPIFHVHGLFVANHCALTSGARILWHDRFDPAAVIRDIERATVFMGVPTYYIRLLQDSDLTLTSCAHMRLFVSGSAPLLAETHRAFEQRSGHRILERYGMSETGMITSNPIDGERRPGTVGPTLPGVLVRVVDDADRPLPAGDKGAIQVKGENVFSAYWRMPEKTRQEFTEDGWFRTGDIGVFDSDGYLSIVGRAKDLIITGGYNVYPKEIELLLDDLPEIMESAVIGVPHPDFGEAVTAVVVARPNAKIDEARTIVALKSQLAGFKVPKRVHLVDELPRNAMGKVQKNILRERFG